MDARTTYEKGHAEREAEVRRAEGRARVVGNLRLLVVVGAIALIGAIVWAPLPPVAWQGVIALVVAFGALVVVHARVYAAKERSAAALRFHQRGLDRLGGKWAEFPSRGDRFLKDEHPYADDLDVFGKGSLFQLLDATETRFGEERLAAWLAGERPKEGWAEALAERQAAVRDLSSRIVFRERLATVGALLGEQKPDPDPFLKWAEGARVLPKGPLLRAVGIALPALFVGVVAFGGALGLPNGAWVLVVAAEIVVAWLLRAKVLPQLSAVSSREQSVASYADMFEAIEAEAFTAPSLVRAKATLGASGAEVTREMRRLGRVVGFIDARNNEVFRFFIAPLLLWDLHCALSLEAWRARAGKTVRGWFSVLGDLEATASLAGFAFDRPDHAYPQAVAEPRLSAKALGHPLIAPARRVCNDLELAGPGAGLVVTGSNMSGKSTLLRSIGVNAVLALAGAPVCAESLVIGPLAVAASMRVRDSLGEGVSRFYAELRKLKRVVDMARAAPGVLFLLDEILHGTNSRERLIGARAIVRELLAKGALGAVSTHDLSIGDLETSMPGSVKNVHFEEQVSDTDEMTFDYKLKPGVVQSSNALRLMKIVGIDVVD